MKCQKCKKKSHLEFKCACGETYCANCRLPEIHGCEQEKKKVELPKIVAPKMEKV